MKIVAGEIEYKDDEVYLSDLGLTYVQNGDCVQGSDDVQELKIFTENGGVGDYLILQTERWAIDDVDDIIKILEHFKKLQEHV